MDHFPATCRVITTCFQNLDYTRLHPVRYRNLGHGSLLSICVSGRWLVASGSNLSGYSDAYSATVYVYNLPGLQPKYILPDVFYTCAVICADSEGRVFGGCFNRVAMLEISETGNLTFSRNLTAGGRLVGRETTVAVGATPGQLWVGCSRGFRGDICDIYLIDIDNDTVIQTIDSISYHSGHVSQQLTGELLITWIGRSTVVHLYQSYISLPPTNLTVTVIGDPSRLLADRNHFLLLDRQANTILILDSQGDLVHTVDDLNGKHGIWMKIQDVAVWENNLLVGDTYGNVMILSML